MATRRKAPAALRLPERFTVENAQTVLDDLRARIGKGGTVTVDLSQLATVDTAGLQLLAVVRRQLAANGQPCEFTSASDAVRDSALLLGLHDLLEWA